MKMLKPIQQKPRPVPFNVRDDADKELERLESLEIIEKLLVLRHGSVL